MTLQAQMLCVVRLCSFSNLPRFVGRLVACTGWVASILWRTIWQGGPVRRECASNCSSPVVHATTANTGSWTDSDSSKFPDAGEEITCTIVVANEGTVTLKDVEVTDTSGDVSCKETQPVKGLGVGESYQCTTSHEV